MISVLKFPLQVGLQRVTLPGLWVGRPYIAFQGSQPCMWVPVNKQREQSEFEILLTLTGEDLDPAWVDPRGGLECEYLGPAITSDGSFVVHFFLRPVR